MDSALIVSAWDKSTHLLRGMLGEASIAQIAAVSSCAQARRLVMERDFDLVVVNAPLGDESGEALARHIACRGQGQVILMVESGLFDAVSNLCEGDGVLTIAKPVDRAFLWLALKLAGSAQNRLRHAREENDRLRQKLEDIQIINRAKCLLVAQQGIDEREAHRYIEKRAMDLRFTRRQVAQEILDAHER